MTSDIGDRRLQAGTWSGIAVGIANELAAGALSPGDLAELRRMDPDAPKTPAFWRLAARRNLLGNSAVEQKWALAINGIALMTRTAGNSEFDRSAHDPSIPVGRAFFCGADSSRSTAFITGSRLTRLLTARRQMLRTLLGRMFRMMGAAGAQFDWRQMALLILIEDLDEQRAGSIRMEIARAYYVTEARVTRTTG